LQSIPASLTRTGSPCSRDRSWSDERFIGLLYRMRRFPLKSMCRHLRLTKNSRTDAIPRSHHEKPAQQLRPLQRQKAFGMKLHAEQRILAVTDAHDLLPPLGVDAPRADFEIIAQRAGADDQAVIA